MFTIMYNIIMTDIIHITNLASATHIFSQARS